MMRAKRDTSWLVELGDAEGNCLKKPTDLDNAWQRYGHLLAFEKKARTGDKINVDQFHLMRLLALWGASSLVVVFEPESPSHPPCEACGSTGDFIRGDTRLWVADITEVDSQNGFGLSLDAQWWLRTTGAGWIRAVNEFYRLSDECNEACSGRCVERGHGTPSGWKVASAFRSPTTA